MYFSNIIFLSINFLSQNSIIKIIFMILEKILILF